MILVRSLTKSGNVFHLYNIYYELEDSGIKLNTLGS
ncbi:hypothetical protein FD729_04980 [Pantoea sp. Nvir]|nr:hypothetical protein [Pantoea sp. Nvir]